jgi:molybdopterin-guanine dinucleotide biosynthesis protein B
MKTISVYGTKKSGKTTIVTSLVRALKQQGYHVASLKFMERADRVDVSGTETDLHRKAGAELVVASARRETAVFRAIDERDDLPQLLDCVEGDFDYLICEGHPDPDIPRIATAKYEGQLAEVVNDETFAISGIVAATPVEHELPAFDVNKDLTSLVALIEQLWPTHVERSV